METSLIILILLGVLILWFIISYNKFVRLVTRAKEALSDIEVQMKRRYDLIPNLIETVKGYASHEQATLEKVINARNIAMSSRGVKAEGEANNMITESLKSIFALSESYPDLKANQNFLELQRELSDTENKIQASRRFYNTNVRDLNIGIDSFPSNIIARLFNFRKMEFFETENEAEKQPVKVQF